MVNIALIFTLLGMFLCQNLTYAKTGISCLFHTLLYASPFPANKESLRVPIGNLKRLKTVGLIEKSKLNPAASRVIHLVGVFPGYDSMGSYKNLADVYKIYEMKIPEIQALYDRAAKILGFTGENGEPDPTKLFNLASFPEDRLKRRQVLLSAFIVHNLALEAYLRHIAQETGIEVEFDAYTGRSIGVFISAIASKALSLEDGIKISFALVGFIAKNIKEQNHQHVIIIKGNNSNVVSVMKKMKKQFGDDVEVYEDYSPSQCNVYVNKEIYEGFKHDFLDNKAEAGVEVIVGHATDILMHYRGMGSVRRELEKYILDNIKIKDPRIPIIPNNGDGVIRKGSDVLKAILDIVDKPMMSRNTLELLEENFKSGALIEIGIGGKSVNFFKDNGIKFPFLGFSGDDYSTASFLEMLRQSISSGVGIIRNSAPLRESL